MSHIWHQAIDLDSLNIGNSDTLMEQLGMQYTECGDDFLTMSMPVDQRTHQPYGLLHGGASAALAESVASHAAMLTLNPETHFVVGIELNCNHVRGVKSGRVFGKATPFHIGGSTQVWQIEITDDSGKRVCISRCTLSVLERRN